MTRLLKITHRLQFHSGTIFSPPPHSGMYERPDCYGTHNLTSYHYYSAEEHAIHFYIYFCPKSLMNKKQVHVSLSIMTCVVFRE